MAPTFDCISVATEREPSGLASFTGHTPDRLLLAVRLRLNAEQSPFTRRLAPFGLQMRDLLSLPQQPRFRIQFQRVELTKLDFFPR